MIRDSTDQEMLYELGDTMFECTECRKTAVEDYELADWCQCDTRLRITVVPSRLERGDAVDVTHGPFDGYTGVVRGLSAPKRVELRLRSRDVKRPVKVRLTDVTQTGEMVDPETMALERPGDRGGRVLLPGVRAERITRV